MTDRRGTTQSKNYTMKQKLKNTARKLANKPVIGTIIRTGVGVLKFPARYNFFMNQLPQLLENTSKLNHQLHDRENFSRTAPITLRKLTRDVANLRRELDRLQAAVAPPAFAGARSIDTRCWGDLQIQIEDGSSASIHYRPGSGQASVSSLEDLPLAKASVSSIVITRGLESISPTRLNESVLPRIFELLKPQGELRAEFVDAQRLLEKWKSGEIHMPELRAAMFGTSDGEPVRNLLAGDELLAMLQNAGFRDVRLAASTSDADRFTATAAKGSAP